MSCQAAKWLNTKFLSSRLPSCYLLKQRECLLSFSSPPFFLSFLVLVLTPYATFSSYLTARRTKQRGLRRILLLASPVIHPALAPLDKAVNQLEEVDMLDKEIIYARSRFVLPSVGFQNHCNGAEIKL